MAGVDWDFELGELSVNGMVQRLSDILAPLLRLYVPEVNSSNKFHYVARPPGSLKRRRARAWQQYKQARQTYGRSSLLADVALDHYNAINNQFRSFHISSRVEYECLLIDRIKEYPKAFNFYIWSKKVGNPTVGPLRSTDELVISTMHFITRVSRFFDNNFVTLSWIAIRFQHNFFTSLRNI